MTALERWLSYDAVAESYNIGRPGYPEPLIDECVKFTGLTGDSRILEIGCGSGQATLPFARRGFNMTCLEPGPNLANLARKNLAGFPNISIREERFEDWPLEPDSFDFILAATSIHHVANDVRYPKTALALKTGGFIAILGNYPGADEPEFRKDLDRIYAHRWGGETARVFAKQTLENRIGATKKQIDDSGKFGKVIILQHPWTIEYDVARYMALLDSDSGRLNHLPEVQEGLKRDIAQVITRMGGTVRRGYVAVMALAQRR